MRSLFCFCWAGSKCENTIHDGWTADISSRRDNFPNAIDGLKQKTRCRVQIYYNIETITIYIRDLALGTPGSVDDGYGRMKQIWEQ